MLHVSAHQGHDQTFIVLIHYITYFCMHVSSDVDFWSQNIMAFVKGFFFYSND